MIKNTFFSACLLGLLLSMNLGCGKKEKKTVELEAEADSHVRADLSDRENDNYGCHEFMTVGTNRVGTPDAMRALIRFDLQAIPPKSSIKTARLTLTVHSFDNGTPSSTYTVNIHRIVDSGPRTPWQEGNGAERTPQPSGCVWVDEASGVAWVGAGDGGDANNQTQPDFDPAVVASATVNQGATSPGDTLGWDITALVQEWIDKTSPNHGILLRDTTTAGLFLFRGVRFGDREGKIHNIPGSVDGPRLTATFVRK